MGKPAIPDISIAVPTALLGTQQVNPAVVKVQKEAFVVNEPVHVEKPYAVPYPYPVRGEDIVEVTRTEPIVKHTHLGHQGYAGFGYAAAPLAAAHAIPAATLVHH